MSTPSASHSLTLVSACMTADGLPEFALTTVEVTEEEEAEGRHYELAEVQLLARSYEEPFVHFAPGESPAFLVAAVRQHLGMPGAADRPLVVEKP